MQQLKHCLNPKAIAALAAVAVGTWVFAPGAFAAALPFLILAICPLSMVGMMYMMRGVGQGASAGAGSHSQGATQQLRDDMAEGTDDGRVIEALQARVGELEARLAVESRRDEARPGEAAAHAPFPHEG